MFLTYDCSLEGNRRPPITVTVRDRAGAALRVHRRGHDFRLEVTPSRDVFCVFPAPWGREGTELMRALVGVNARFH
jgi:hypothetical protein